MLRTEGYRPSSKTVNIIFMNGGVGDHVASLVAANYMIKRYDWISFLLWMPDFLVSFAKNVLPTHAKVFAYSDMKAKYNENLPTKTTAWDGITSPMKIHILDYAFLKLCDENPGIEYKNYLKINLKQVKDLPNTHLPEKYVVLTTGYTAKTREFHPNMVNELVNYVISKGYTPVFLGQTQTQTGSRHVIQGTFKEDINYDKGINLINKTSLLEAAKIMHYSQAVIGVDCGLLHIAGCTDTNIVAGFTTVSPSLRAPVRNNILGYKFYPVIPEESLACKFCQSNTNFLYGHDYKECIYDDYLCVNQLTADKFIEQLEKLL